MKIRWSASHFRAPWIIVLTQVSSSLQQPIITFRYMEISIEEACTFVPLWRYPSVLHHMRQRSKSCSALLPVPSRSQPPSFSPKTTNTFCNPQSRREHLAHLRPAKVNFQAKKTADSIMAGLVFSLLSPTAETWHQLTELKQTKSSHSWRDLYHRPQRMMREPYFPLEKRICGATLPSDWRSFISDKFSRK